MTQLLIHLPDEREHPLPETAFGGKPSAPHGRLAWPVCRTCKGHMQFLGQLRREASHELLLLFMCQNEPGMCDEWEPDGGGNAVVPVAATDLQWVEPPPSGEALRGTRYGARLVQQDDGDYGAAREAWAASHGASPREVLGQMGGTPAWIQGEEVPVCLACERRMDFVAQLESGPHWQTEMNFGGGCAYVFHCACGASRPKFLWQC